MRMKNKIVLITGATGQLGRQYSKAFANEGANVWISDLDINNCLALKKELPGKHEAIELDVSQEKNVIECFQTIYKISKKIDVIINNAGIAVFEPFEERKFEDFMNVMKVNAGGTFLMIKHGSELMKLNKGGSIINIASVYGIVSGDPRIYTDCKRNTSEVYGASKAAIIHMTKYFAVHLAKYNIRVNSISPGGIFNNQGDNFVKNYSYKTPMNRMGDETELAETALFLSSDASSYITGQNIVVDGGFTIW